MDDKEPNTNLDWWELEMEADIERGDGDGRWLGYVALASFAALVLAALWLML